jgi:hypothetical protein
MQAAIGLTGTNPQNVASVAGRTAFDALEKSKKQTADLAWKDPLLKQTSVKKDNALNAIDDHLNSIGLDVDSIDPAVITRINRIKSLEGDTVPLMEIQNLRALIGDKSRQAYDTNQKALGQIHQDLGEKIYQVLADKDNIHLGDASGAKFAAWDNARAATKDYYDTFRPDFMDKLRAVDSAGMPKISSEAFFDKMFSGPNAVQNLQQTRNVLGQSIDPHISDWIIGDLTNNGKKIDLKQSDVARYLANPKNAALVDEVPGLRGRMTDLAQRAGESAQESTLRQLNKNFSDIASSGNPQKIADFLSANGAALKSTLATPGEKAFIDAVQRSANLMAPAKAGVASYSKTLNALENGRMIDVVLGNKLGVISDLATGEILSHLFSALSGIPISTGIGASLAGVSKNVFSIPETASKIILGDIKGLTVQQLQKAAADPELMRLLMSKPSPEVAMNLHKRLMAMGLGIEQVNALEKPKDDRRVRASGGRIGGSSIGDKLVLAAEKAKKENSKATETLLNVNDENIAKALEIANRNL